MNMLANSQHQDNDIPAANTPAEVNIHLGYIRRDIQNLQQETTKAIDMLGRKIDGLDDHYVTESEFRPIADQAKASASELKLITEWRDTFNGKMIGLGLAIAAGSALLSFALNYFF
jgi:hypothetical protein